MEMDPAFLDSLKSAGVAQATIEVLENEMVLTSEIFYSLAESHFQHILPKIKVGQHALLLSIWHDNIMSTHTAKHFKVDEIVDDSYRSKRSTSTGSVSSECKSSCSPAPESSAKKLLTASSDIKDLVEVYKANAVSRFNKGCNVVKKPEKSPAKTMKILLGGMIFDPKKGKGIRKKFLPEPNPTTVEVEKSDTLLFIIKKAIDLYYREFDIAVEDIMFCDSAGTVIKCNLDQKIGEYYSANNFVPSRHKLYTAISLDVCQRKDSEEIDKKMDASKQKTDDCKCDSVSHNQSNFTTLEETEAVIRTCIECGRSYRTYIPDTSCNLPNGSVVTYTTPQLTCPLCDDYSFGDFMNYDLFPELINPATETSH